MAYARMRTFTAKCVNFDVCGETVERVNQRPDFKCFNCRASEQRARNNARTKKMREERDKNK